MVELGQLEKHHAAFEKRNTQFFVASVDGLEDSKEVQKSFPHLQVVSDPNHKLVDAANVGHPNAGPHGENVAAPTTFILDRNGIVRWMFRPNYVTDRLSAQDLLSQYDRVFPTN